MYYEKLSPLASRAGGCAGLPEGSPPPKKKTPSCALEARTPRTPPCFHGDFSFPERRRMFPPGHFCPGPCAARPFFPLENGPLPPQSRASPPFPIGDGALPRMPRPLPSPSAPAPPNAAADYLAARPRRRGFFRRQASSAGSFPARMVDAAPFCPILNVPRMTPSAFAPGHPEESASRRTPPRPHQRASALSGRSS